MKPKRITKEQYLTLAALKMPVYSDNRYLSQHELLLRLNNRVTQQYEHHNYVGFSVQYQIFHTLVEEEESSDERSEVNGQPLGVDTK